MADKQEAEVILVRNVRLSFPKIWKAEPFTTKAGKTVGDPKFSCAVLIPKDSEAHREITKKIAALVRQTAVAKWGDVPKEYYQKCFGDGDTKKYDGYEGHYFLQASNRKRPNIFDAAKNTVLHQDAIDNDILFGGDYVNLLCSFWAHDEPTPGVRANLIGLQFVRRGERFGGGYTAKAEDFPDESAGDPEADTTDIDSMLG